MEVKIKCDIFAAINDKKRIWTRRYWLDIADYDMETAEAMLQTRRWLYVGFMCHQVMEKTIKAYWHKKREDDPPYIHNLKRLAQGCGLYTSLSDEQRMLLDTLTPLNIEARYPTYKDELSRALNEGSCSDIISKTKHLQLWIKQKL